ncbi:uncharacterized protein LOC120486555 [Pimephales promelas]|uniref:uncharacterized protein LOC120486555 n=1 Tax=Pimephales promelas TaxID=90988 RepID=UPI001955CA4C|nr:uncharacterized protein LOC120486555 [Pimephales promelas]
MDKHLGHWFDASLFLSCCYEPHSVISSLGSSGVEPERVSVMVGDSVTLHTGVQTSQQDNIRWYYNDIRIAQINRDQSKICTDDQCNEDTERFRDRLKLDHQTGSLTIMNTRNTHSGEYKLKISSGSSDSEKIFIVSVTDFLCVVSNGVSVSVMEGDSVTLNTGVEIKHEDIKWYFNDICIAQKNSGDQNKSKICTDDQYEDTDERFRDRLKLDHQTGSLTITHTTNTDSGVYKLLIISSSDNEKTFIVTVHGVDTDGVSVMEGDSVTLYTGVQTNQQDRIRWYYDNTRIAQINRDQSKICTDVQCNKDTERFRDRLKLDHQTGSLTIMNITNTHSGEYQLQISSGSSDSDNTFNVILYGVSAAERDTIKRKSVKERESVILYTGVIRNLKDSVRWYYNEILIAEISDEPRKNCTDDQCDERFRDRLKLDHQTGSLIITHTRTEDSGEYQLQINNSRFSIIRSFRVSVTAVPVSGLSSSAVGVICAAAGVCILLVAAGIYCHHRSKQTGNWTPCHDHHQEDGVSSTDWS